MPAHSWEAPFQRLHLEDLKKTEFNPDKRSNGCKLKKGEQIEGAQVKAGDLRLVIE
jgi:hypothetical protein